MKKILILTALLTITFFSFSQHTLVLKNGDKLNGVVMEIKDDVLSIVIGRSTKTYPMVEVSSIFFNEYVPYDGEALTDTEEKSLKVLKKL